MCMELQDQKEILWERFREVYKYSLYFVSKECFEHVFDRLVEYDFEGMCLDMKGSVQRYLDEGTIGC